MGTPGYEACILKGAMRGRVQEFEASSKSTGTFGLDFNLETMVHTLPLSSQELFSLSLVLLYVSFFLILEI